MDNRALQGIRVIDLSMGWAGPLAARHLADMGAQVIKVESCERFDWWRSWEATPEWIEDDGAEKSVAFNMVNRNKKNLTLDLENPHGRALLLDLVKEANVVVENYSGAVLPKLGLSYEVFKAVNPKIILLSMPAFGADGPWAEFRAYGSTVEQSSGLPHLNGMENDLPTMHHVAYGDAMGGITGGAALLVALRHQARTGEGQFVDLSQVEGLFPLGIHGILAQSAQGHPPERNGNQHGGIAPHGVYPCKGDDDWIVIQVFTEAQWSALKQKSGLTFGDLNDRLAHTDELDEALAAWTKPQESGALMRELQELSIPAAATYKLSQLLNHEQLTARQFWQWRERAFVGKQPNPSAPYRTGTAPLQIDTPAPTLGEHNHDVLNGILQLSEKKIAELEAEGIVGTKPRMPSK